MCTVDEIAIYETRLEEETTVDVPAMLREKAVDYITFTSSTTATYFMEKIGVENLPLLADTTCVSIGPITSQKMRDLGMNVDIEAQEYTIDGILDAIKNTQTGGKKCYPHD